VTASRNQGQYSSLTFDGSEPEILYYTPTYNVVDEAVPSAESEPDPHHQRRCDLDQATNSDGDDTISWITSDGLQINGYLIRLEPAYAAMPAGLIGFIRLTRNQSKSAASNG